MTGAAWLVFLSIDFLRSYLEERSASVPDDFGMQVAPAASLEPLLQHAQTSNNIQLAVLETTLQNLASQRPSDSALRQLKIQIFYAADHASSFSVDIREKELRDILCVRQNIQNVGATIVILAPYPKPYANRIEGQFLKLSDQRFLSHALLKPRELTRRLSQQGLPRTGQGDELPVAPHILDQPQGQEPSSEPASRPAVAPFSTSQSAEAQSIRPAVAKIVAPTPPALANFNAAMVRALMTWGNGSALAQLSSIVLSLILLRLLLEFRPLALASNAVELSEKEHRYSSGDSSIGILGVIHQSLRAWIQQSGQNSDAPLVEAQQTIFAHLSPLIQGLSKVAEATIDNGLSQAGSFQAGGVALAAFLDNLDEPSANTAPVPIGAASPLQVLWDGAGAIAHLGEASLSALHSTFTVFSPAVLLDVAGPSSGVPLLSAAFSAIASPDIWLPELTAASVGDRSPSSLPPVFNLNGESAASTVDLGSTSPGDASQDSASQSNNSQSNNSAGDLNSFEQPSGTAEAPVAVSTTSPSLTAQSGGSSDANPDASSDSGLSTGNDAVPILEAPDPDLVPGDLQGNSQDNFQDSLPGINPSPSQSPSPSLDAAEPDSGPIITASAESTTDTPETLPQDSEPITPIDSPGPTAPGESTPSGPVPSPPITPPEIPTIPTETSPPSDLALSDLVLDVAGGLHVVEIVDPAQLAPTRLDSPQAQWITIRNFGGVGTDTSPSGQALAEIDTLRLHGPGFSAAAMIMDQVGEDLLLTFETMPDFGIRLLNFALEDFENLVQSSAETTVGNILFPGDRAILDHLDVFNRNWTLTGVMNPNTVTYLNDLDNQVWGQQGAENVINGQGGHDELIGRDQNDLLRGGAGDDKLVGGGGDNLLMGGEGSDIFQAGLDGFTIAADFDPTTDQIWLSQGLGFDDLTFEQAEVADFSILGSQVYPADGPSFGTLVKANAQAFLMLPGFQPDQVSADWFSSLEPQQRQLGL